MTEIFNSKHEGFKPHLARDILDLPKERFRYWRKKLDPIPQRALFSFMDILAYRVMKELIDHQSSQVEYLSELDFTEMFSLFNSANTREIRSMVVVLDRNSNLLKIVFSKSDAVEILCNGVALVFVDELMDQQTDAFIKYGRNDNVVPITNSRESLRA